MSAVALTGHGAIEPECLLRVRSGHVLRAQAMSAQSRPQGMPARTCSEISAMSTIGTTDIRKFGRRVGLRPKGTCPANALNP